MEESVGNDREHIFIKGDIMRIKNHQQGGSIIAILIIIGILVWLGLKIFPMYSEKSKMVMSVESLIAQPEVAKKSPAQLKTMLLTRLDVNGVSYINSANFNDVVKIEKISGGFKMSVKYYRKEVLKGDFYLLLESEHVVEVTQ